MSWDGGSWYVKTPSSTSSCAVFSLLAQSCLTLCNPMDYIPLGSPVHGILQARILEWVAMPSSRASSYPGIKPRSPALQADSLPSEPLGKPQPSHTLFLIRHGAVQWLVTGALAATRSECPTLKAGLYSHCKYLHTHKACIVWLCVCRHPFAHSNLPESGLYLSLVAILRHP